MRHEVTILIKNDYEDHCLRSAIESLKKNTDTGYIDFLGSESAGIADHWWIKVGFESFHTLFLLGAFTQDNIESTLNQYDESKNIHH